MKLDVLKSHDTHRLERKSSISQHGGMLAVKKYNEWCPLVADVIDYVKCGKIYSHKAAVTDKPTIGYTFPVGTCTYVSDLYLMGQQDNVTTEKLPEWFGMGFYESHNVKNTFLNDETNQALGLHQTEVLRVGKDYVVAKHMLKADK